MTEEGTTEDIAPGKTLRVELDGRAGQCLCLSFNVEGGRDIDYFTAVVGDGEPLLRPMRRARSLVEETMTEPLQADGKVVLTWDNGAAWLYRRVTYTAEMVSASAAAARSKGREDAPATPAGDASGGDWHAHDDPWTEIYLAAGASNEVSVRVTHGSRLAVEFEVVSGADCDFGIMLAPASGTGGIRLHGPTRRARSMRTGIPVPEDGTAYVGFDNSSSWFRSKYIRYRFRCETDANC